MSDCAETPARHATTNHGVEDVFRPSDYTSFLIETLRANRRRLRGARALEVGCGSGVILACLGAAGASAICGTDVERAAIETSAETIRASGFARIAELRHGDMWSPVARRKFDIIVANLPHFPSFRPNCPDRLASWSSAGPRGRGLLDRFLDGVGEHLAPGGRAMITHSGFLDLAETDAVLSANGLAWHIAATRLLHLPTEKLRSMTHGVLEAELGRSIFVYGAYAFVEVHIVEISQHEAGG